VFAQPFPKAFSVRHKERGQLTTCAVYGGVRKSLIREDLGTFYDTSSLHPLKDLIFSANKMFRLIEKKVALTFLTRVSVPCTLFLQASKDTAANKSPDRVADLKRRRNDD